MNHLCFTPPGLSSLTLRSGFLGSQVCAKPALRATAYRRYVKSSRRRCVSLAAGSSVSEQLGSKDFLERIRGINRIEEMSGTSQRINALIPIATEDENQQVRYAAISRISNLDHEALSEDDAFKVLNAARYVLLNDKESSCQSGAADLIAGLRLSDGFDDLVETFHRTSDWMLKFSIAAGLGEMGDPKAFDFLTSILENDKESDFLLLAAAIGALGELGDERGIPVVQKYLENEDASIRERANIAHNMLLSKK